MKLRKQSFLSCIEFENETDFSIFYSNLNNAIAVCDGDCLIYLKELKNSIDKEIWPPL